MPYFVVRGEGTFLEGLDIGPSHSEQMREGVTAHAAQLQKNFCEFLTRWLD